MQQTSHPPRRDDADLLESRTRVASRERGIDRAVQILDFMHAAGRPVAVGEISRGLSAPRSTIYSLVRSLSDLGLVETTAEGKLTFGRKIHLWGQDYLNGNPLMRRGREAVDRLAADTGETAELCALQDGRYVILHMQPGQRMFRISSAVGLRIPLPWTASGRLLLSAFSTAEVDAMVSDADLVLADGSRLDRAELHREIAEAADAGAWIASGLVDAFTTCLAAPILNGAGTCVATVCLVVPRELPPARVAELCAVLKQAAAAASDARRQPSESAATATPLRQP